MSKYSTKKEEVWRIVGSFVPHEIKVANRLGKDAFQWLDLRLKELFNLYIRGIIPDATVKYYIKQDIDKARRMGIGSILERLSDPEHTLSMLTTVGGVVELEDKQIAVYQRDKLLPDLEKLAMTAQDEDWNKYADWLLSYWKKIKKDLYSQIPWVTGEIEIKRKEVKKLREEKVDEIPVSEELPEPLISRIKHNIGLLFAPAKKMLKAVAVILFFPYYIYKWYKGRKNRK